jgi:hypothetical protein
MPPAVEDEEHHPSPTKSARALVASLGDLPDEMISAVLAAAAASADSPADLLFAIMT